MLLGRIVRAVVRTLVVLAPLVASHVTSLRDLCKDAGIAELSVFGSATRPDFTDTSDVDLIVRFQPGHTPSLIELGILQARMTKILGRPVDLVTPNELHPRIRERVLGERTIIYGR